MQRVAVVCLLLAGLSSGQDSGTELSDPPADVEKKDTPTVLSPDSSTKASEPTSTATSPPDLVAQSTTKAASDGTTTTKPSNVSQQPTDQLLNATAKEEGATTKEALKDLVTQATTGPTPTPTASTVPSTHPKTENQSAVPTPESPVSTSRPDAPVSEVSVSLSTAGTVPQNTSQPPDAVDASSASPSSTSPSYSSVILPVVIALIVITLSVFVLVGLYRICRKTDPGTQENGNDQPQSDKESVKLLTVKTISHEPGEHSAQGKSKN
ncbi:endomucin [Sorex araneus]|uniref:endomucin n=1 Tax=Sorex araneus TaxID=42254 RepID=UPI002433CFBA|nr:endomucin [Sorex araneus]